MSVFQCKERLLSFTSVIFLFIIIMILTKYNIYSSDIITQTPPHDLLHQSTHQLQQSCQQQNSLKEISFKRQKYIYNKKPLNYFQQNIFSSMLQEQTTFAVENSRQKYARQSTCSSSDQYNNLLNKLRERNVNNDIYIKKYVRKSNRKLQFLQRMKVQPIQSNTKIQAQILQIKRQAKQLKIVEIQKIDKQDETMIMKQPVTISLAISIETNNQSRTNQSNSQPYQKFSPKEEQKTEGIINNRYKSNKELASYLKNIFLKDGCPKNDRKMIKRKEQMKKVIIQSKENDESRQLYRTKYHLSVKNYVFGSQNIQCKKSVEVDQNKYKQGRIVTELINRYKIQKISQENLLSQGSISSKAIFPSLNSQNHKPRISLDKCIKSGHERGIKQNLLEDKFKQGKLRIQRQSRVKIQRQGKLHSDNQQTGYQILNFKINTIQIKKFN